MTSYRGLCVIITSHRRGYDVITASYACRVMAMKFDKKDSVGTWRQMTSYLRRFNVIVASTSVRHRFDIMCLLGRRDFGLCQLHTSQWLHPKRNIATVLPNCFFFFFFFFIFSYLFVYFNFYNGFDVISTSCARWALSKEKKRTRDTKIADSV